MWSYSTTVATRVALTTGRIWRTAFTRVFHRVQGDGTPRFGLQVELVTSGSQSVTALPVSNTCLDNISAEENGYFHGANVTDPYFLDRDDLLRHGQTYRTFYYMSEFDLSATLEHLRKLPAIEQFTHGEHDGDEGWWLKFVFCGEEFFVDTWFHGTSTTLQVLNWECDEYVMLALIGCFAPLIAYREPCLPIPRESLDEVLLQPGHILMFFAGGITGSLITIMALVKMMLD